MKNVKTKIVEVKDSVLAFLKANAALLIGVALIGFVFGHGCGSGEDTGDKVDAKKYDSVVVQLALAHEQIKVTDSLNRITLDRHRRQNDSTIKLRDQAKAEARKAAENAAYWQGVAKQADEANDTETGLAARDSQIVALNDVIAQRNRELEMVDSIIYRKDLDISLLEAANTAKSSLIDRQRLTIDKLNSDYHALAKENAQLKVKAKRKKFWGNIWSGLKVGGAAVGGFVVGRAIK